MTVLQYVLHSHFCWGFALGLILVIYVWIRGIQKRGDLKRRVKDLETTIKTKMELEREQSHGTLDKIRELEEKIRKQDQLLVNQKSTIEIMKERPGKQELRELSRYQKAYQILTLQIPGFATAWQAAKQKILDEEKEENSGLSVFTRPIVNLFSGSISSSGDEVRPALPDSHADDGKK